MQRLDPRQCTVLVIDVQERLASAMPAHQMSELVRATTVLVEAAHLLGARLLVTEQYPAGLGHTVAPIADRLKLAGASAPVEKTSFSACDDEQFQRAWNAASSRAAIVVGMEAHVCVYQTVRELCARGVEVHVPLDGVASRRDDHRAVGLDLCRASGAIVTSMETVVFDWLARATSPAFKQLSKLIR